MNEVFDIKRFGKLVKYELVNYMPRFFKLLLIFASIIVAVWLFSFTVDFNILSRSRARLVAVLMTTASVLSPYIVYKDMNNSKKGYMYAMIPASTLEKLLSMVVVCMICVPAITYAVLTATDIVLFLFSKIGMGSFLYTNLYNPFFYVPSYLFETLFSESMNEYSYNVFNSLLYFFSTIAYTMMFNTIFRKNKVLKTIMFNIALSFAVSLLLTIVVSVPSPEFWDVQFERFASCFENISYKDVINVLMTLYRIWGCLLIIFCLAITYCRIKKVNY